MAYDRFFSAVCFYPATKTSNNIYKVRYILYHDLIILSNVLLTKNKPL